MIDRLVASLGRFSLQEKCRITGHIERPVKRIERPRGFHEAILMPVAFFSVARRVAAVPVMVRWTDQSSGRGHGDMKGTAREVSTQ